MSLSGNYYVKRTGQALLTLYVVITISFGLIRLLPGSPVTYMKAKYIQQRRQSGQSIDIRRINNLVESYTNVNPSEPISTQYYDYVSSILTGDFGQSIWQQEPVLKVLGQALPWTLLVMSVSLIVTFTISVSLGAIMSYYEGSTFDVSATVSTIFLRSIPYYIAGILMVYFLGYVWNIFPTSGAVNPTIESKLSISFIGSVIYHATLPILSLVITGIDPIGMRGNSIQILGKDYVKVAQLRGIADRRIALRYVARNAILPFYTGLMISIGVLFGGSVILETIFTYPGVGYYLFQAIGSRDYPLMMGGFIIITSATVLGIYIADLTYGKLDPRAGTNEQEAY